MICQQFVNLNVKIMKAITKITGFVSIVLISFSGSAQEVKQNAEPVKTIILPKAIMNKVLKHKNTSNNKDRPLKQIVSVKQISVKE